MRWIVWLVKLEIGIWRSLFLWLVRRVPGKGPGAEDFSYAKEITPIIIAITFVSALELPVVHLLIPQSRRWRRGAAASTRAAWSSRTASPTCRCSSRPACA